ncbi:MAG TPA: cytochrome c3 family protein [Malonomonas sp.]
MKKALVLAIAVALLATPAFAVITNSKHDLSPGSTTPLKNTGTNTELCVYCHTPHAADVSVTTAPLWNRGVQNASGTVYVGLEITAVYDINSINQTDAPLCLSCHDGVVGNALVNAPNTGTVDLAAVDAGFSADALIGGAAANDLNNDHPIGFIYTNVSSADAGADTEIKAKAVVEAVGGMAGAVSYGATNNMMWCSSCHDVHDNANAPFLRVNNAGSDLCLACHDK